MLMLLKLYIYIIYYLLGGLFALISALISNAETLFAGL